MIDSRNQLRSTELAKRREIIFHIQVDKQGYFVRYFDPSLILFDAVSLELGICHKGFFFNSHLNFATNELSVTEVLVCCTTPSQLGQIPAANLKNAKHFGKKQNTKNPHLRNRGRCLHHELRFRKVQN